MRSSFQPKAKNGERRTRHPEFAEAAVLSTSEAGHHFRIENRKHSSFGIPVSLADEHRRSPSGHNTDR